MGTVVGELKRGCIPRQNKIAECERAVINNEKFTKIGQGIDDSNSDDSDSGIEENIESQKADKVTTLAEDRAEDVVKQTGSFNIPQCSSPSTKCRPSPTEAAWSVSPASGRPPLCPSVPIQRIFSVSTKSDSSLSRSKKQGYWHECYMDCLSTHPDFENPFAPAVQRLMATLATPVSALPGYQVVPGSTPTLRPGSKILLEGETFHIEALRGEGGFAKVHSASWQGGEEERCVLKVQRPANDWEWYILGEVAKRVNKSAPHLSSSYMTASRCFTFSDGSMLVSRLAPIGSLLDLINATKKDKTIAEPLALHLAAEILELVHHLHLLDLIHADLKPDNFLVTDFPGPHNRALQVIDFGKALDLRMLPKNIVFTEQVSTSGLRCVEMREGRPWRHHIDYFGIAATVYCLLTGKYLQVKKTKSTGRWEPRDFKPRRGWQGPFWQNFFDTLLNLEGGERKCLPNLLDMAGLCREAFRRGDEMQEGWTRLS